MTYNITYVLMRFGLTPDQTVAITGKNQKVYGRAIYEKRYGAHVLRISQKEWEGGADQNIIKRASRAAAVISVRVEVETDTESLEGQLEQEIDFQKQRIQQLEAQVQEVTKQRDATADDLKTIKGMLIQGETAPAPAAPVAPEQPAPAPAAPVDHETLKAMIDAHGAANTGGRLESGEDFSMNAELREMQQAAASENSSGTETLSPNGRQTTETQTIPPETAPAEKSEEAPAEIDPTQAKAEAHDAHVSRLEAMGFPALMVEAREQNAEGAEIDLGIKTKAGLRTALLDWYSRKA